MLHSASSAEVKPFVARRHREKPRRGALFNASEAVMVSARLASPIIDRAGTMMEQQEFRALALTFPETAESSHFDTADFRVRNKIFATLREADARAVLKLSPDEQQLVMATSPGMFEPVKGSWGLKGWTRVVLDRADSDTVRHAMGMAWRSVAPKKLAGGYKL
jgi:hypothetical protein